MHHEETRRRGSQPNIRIKLAYKRYMCVHVAADWLHVLDRQIGSIYMLIASHEIESDVNPDSLRLKAYLDFLNGFGIEYLVREAMRSA